MHNGISVEEFLSTNNQKRESSTAIAEHSTVLGWLRPAAGDGKQGATLWALAFRFGELEMMLRGKALLSGWT